ncbi:hypothetical protein COCC4DRAFT_78894 [Bipolaris maydis ATCC 48331]|uniref:CFEM domain-containing protein n=2 Tax=Cochliobolus heterostrophus TaxID=5016 RepID=M2UUH7_COCH5|nr:uncharacterized protein COCC4DRAFT_78894 [Bipolaris maydis ATCC 48331]EMD91522.1 hypothetical protein COCHEDRAFT_1175538 [Bipolaris maydis C5]KAJ5027305.1 hypothetical protein J3E73DRAFT_422957 [Bipolaris maydis]ENI08720.1 hypothetical protein COCC4DRAFT_78894 [Bipolaris maydis ATCC 48331]KAJ6208909.1 hypothetical protein PSV09DRAFT_1175538 [Bipolaris maydis]KAJ6270799.1 hypothetical protein PSV08DRAFT_401950 [Bipolaris maydis]
MKTFTIASLAVLASVASAQLDNIPQCALSCFIGPLTSDGCANLTDFACHCKKGDTLLSQVQPCVQKACEAADQAKAIAAVESTCQAAGVPITIPDTSAPAASASASAAPAPSSAASAASSVASAASSLISSIATSGTPVPMPTPISTGTPSMTPSMTPSGTPSASGTPTSSVSEFTGAAAQATQAVGIIGAAALAMLAL